MKTLSHTFATIALLTTTILLAGCSYEITGTVKDLETGEPLADVGVGMLVPQSLGPHAEVYVEMGRTDSEGRYLFRSHRVSRTFEARLQNFQTVVQFDRPPVDKVLDVEMRSIADVKGTWDATVTLDGGETRTFQFVFSEEGMAWYEDGDELGIVPLSLRAPEIVIDDYMSFSRFYIIGNVQAEMALDESGDTMTGTITALKLFEFECSPCSATVEATRAGS